MKLVRSPAVRIGHRDRGPGNRQRLAQRGRYASPSLPSSHNRPPMLLSVARQSSPAAHGHNVDVARLADVMSPPGQIQIFGTAFGEANVTPPKRGSVFYAPSQRQPDIARSRGDPAAMPDSTHGTASARRVITARSLAAGFGRRNARAVGPQPGVRKAKASRSARHRLKVATPSGTLKVRIAAVNPRCSSDRRQHLRATRPAVSSSASARAPDRVRRLPFSARAGHRRNTLGAAGKLLGLKSRCFDLAQKDGMGQSRRPN